MRARKVLVGLVAVGVTSIALLAADVLPAVASCTTSCQTAATALTAVVGSTGTRTLTAVTPSLTLSGTTTLTGIVSASVTEVAAPGDNPWYVTLQSSALSGPTVSGSTTAPPTIAAGYLSLAPATLPTGVGCLLASPACTVTAGTGGSLSGAQTLFTVTNEATTTAYSGVYTGSGTISLTVPNAQPSDTYTGTLTATLVQ